MCCLTKLAANSKQKCSGIANRPTAKQLKAGQRRLGRHLNVKKEKSALELEVDELQKMSDDRMDPEDELPAADDWFGCRPDDSDFECDEMDV